MKLALIALVFCTAADLAADELDIARQALRDGLFEVARNHAAKAPDGDLAKLVQLESYAAEERWNDVKALLDRWNGQVKGAPFDYYRALVAGDLAKAAELIEAGGGVAGAIEAQMLRAEVKRKSGDMNGARELWQRVVASTNAPAAAFAVAAINLSDVPALRRASASRLDIAFRRRIALRLGTVLLKDPRTIDEGVRLIREVVKDSPDTPGACEAYLALATVAGGAEKWSEALKVYSETVEIWPEAARRTALRIGRGVAFRRLSRNTEALADFEVAFSLAKDDSVRAEALYRQGEVLTELGRGADALARYREVLTKYPKTEVARRLDKVVKVRELEAKARELFREYRFEEAMNAFGGVAKEEPASADRMAYCEVLCLFGLGRDADARFRAARLSVDAKNAAVRADASLWLAKFAYNREEWKEAVKRFTEFADADGGNASAPSALLWASRAAMYSGEFGNAIQLSTRLVEKYPAVPETSAALIVQSEALMELARYDEAVLVLERISASSLASKGEQLRAALLKADSFFAMGADNTARYVSALEAYRSVELEPGLDPSVRIVVAFKIGSVLEKLKRLEEAVDQYYTRVVLAYRDGHARHEVFDDDARAAFSRAALRLVDEFESRGRGKQAVSILELVAFSDVPASEEAIRRLERISTKGRFL